MQRIKLPSGTIVDVDAVSRIAEPKAYSGTCRSAEYIVAGYPAQAINADADALYQAVEALICNRYTAEQLTDAYSEAK